MLIGCLSVIIVFLFFVALFTIVDTLIIWGLVNLVIWVFGLNFTFTFLQAFVIGLVISFIQNIIRSTRSK